MKKFLSILMLACLLALGMALPAAAEGGTLTTLYVQVVGERRYSKGVTVPVGISRTVKFYIKEEAGYTEVEATPVVENSTIASLIETDKGYEIQGLAPGETTIAMHDDAGAITYPIVIDVPQSSLEVSIDNGGSWSSTVKKLSTEETYPVKFRFGAEASTGVDSDAVYIECASKDIIVEPASGLVFQDDAMIASKLGTYKLSYHGCTADVWVEYQGIADITAEEFENLKKSQSEFLNFLKTEKGYCGTGDFTLRLPAELGDVECSNALPNGTMTLKGAENGTSITNLTVTSGSIAVEDITFTGNPGISLANTNECEISDCIFNFLPFRIQMDEGGNAPQLVLKGNLFTGTAFAEVFDYQNSKVGEWLAFPKPEPEIAALDLGVTVSRFIDGSEVKALAFNVDDSVNSVMDEGWTLKFRFPCGFDSAYAAHNGVAGEGVFESDSSPKSYVMSISEGGRYAVIDGSYPKLSDKNEVVLRDVDVEYLSLITVDTTFSGATVTHNGAQVPAFINNKKLTFCMPETKAAGTYKVTATTAETTTTTTTKTTSRSYKYTYQDYYRVTPAGFSNAMRCVQDNLVTIDCTQAGRKSISLPVESMTAAAEKGYSVLLKNEKVADITIDAAALKSMVQQAKGTTVLLHYKSLNHKTLTTVGQASIQSHLSQFPGDSADLAFLVTATSDSETIEDLQKGTITLKIPFIVLPGTEGAENAVYALQSESTAEARETAVSDGFLTTKLLDLTEHMVFQVGEPAQTTEETTVETTQPDTLPETTAPTEPAESARKGGGLVRGLITGLSVVLAIICGVLGFVFLRKRFRK